MKTISIFTTCYNEEDNIEELYANVKSELEKLKVKKGYNYEHVFIDNASTDRTVGILKDIAAKDKVNIGNYVREASKILGGGGGGKFDFAKGGGKNPEKVDEALEKTKADLTSFLTEHTL